MSLRPKQIIIPIAVFLFFVVATIGACLGFKYINNMSEDSASEDSANTVASTEPTENPTPEKEPEPVKVTPKKLDLQPTIDAWKSKLGRGVKAGVYIYDLDNDAVVGSLNSDTTFATESLYKLFVVYDGYTEVEKGNINPNAKVYGSYTWVKCLDLAIRESHSGCAEAMRAKLGVNKYKLESTPAKIGAIMKKFYEHPDFSKETWETIKDSMLNQPPVNNGMCGGPCDWRRGLPKGFTTGKARVYNKVGWRSNRPAKNWASFNDAALVVFPESKRHYIVVVMTSQSQPSMLTDFGHRFESYILSQE